MKRKEWSWKYKVRIKVENKDFINDIKIKNFNF